MSYIRHCIELGEVQKHMSGDLLCFDAVLICGARFELACEVELAIVCGEDVIKFTIAQPFEYL